MSGGPDSLALLLLAHAASSQSVVAATVDHGLRPESAEEAQMVAALCAKLEIPHTVLTVEVADGNVQSAARAARYQALGGWYDDAGVDVLMTAHHADDQAETLLMRLNRGSGLGGIAGVRRETNIPGHAGTLFRPLLDWRKAELERIVRDAGVNPVHDPSNTDDRFDRARIRKHLAQADWLDPLAIARSAGHLAEAEGIIADLAQREWDTQVKRIGQKLVYRPRAPRLIQLRVISRVLRNFGGSPRGSAIAELQERLMTQGSANLAGVLATAVGDAWRFEPEPPRRSSSCSQSDN